jgi:RNA polymerase sigma-70 factor (ECF subfamily)
LASEPDCRIILVTTTMTDRELERLYDSHAGGLFHYLVTFTKTEADARDLLQELFIKLARGAAKEGVQSEKAWLYRLAHNLAVDWLRRRKVRWDAEERLIKEMEAGHHTTADPDSLLMARHFAEAMKSLPDDQRVVMQLKLWEGMTFEEIAEAQGVPLNTAASRYRYGLEKLRTVLRPLYEELT